MPTLGLGLVTLQPLFLGDDLECSNHALVHLSIHVNVTFIHSHGDSLKLSEFNIILDLSVYFLSPSRLEFQCVVSGTECQGVVIYLDPGEWFIASFNLELVECDNEVVFLEVVSSEIHIEFEIDRELRISLILSSCPCSLNVINFTEYEFNKTVFILQMTTFDIVERYPELTLLWYHYL